MRKQIISVLMVLVMSLTAASCSINSGKQVTTGGSENEVQNSTVQNSDSGQLQILNSDFQISIDDQLSRIKAEYLIQNQGYSDDDKITAILTLNGNSLIDNYLENETYSAKQSLAEYAVSGDGVRLAAKLSENQDKLAARLLSTGLINNLEYKYSAITNAIAVTTTYGNFKILENYDGVERAVLSDTYTRPQSDSSNDASAIVNAVDVYDTGIYNSSSVSFTGKNTAVAVLDSGFDCSHSVFNSDEFDNSDLMLTRTEIDSVLSELNAAQTTPGLSYLDVHYSDKIPFVYDYGGKDPDVFPHDSEHGTHVAGIIGGWNPEENHRGVAKDTQLVLMKVFPDSSEGADTLDILAALEDAVRLGVDAINMSLGMACGFAREPDGEFANDIYDSIAAAGISLITAASNNYSSGFGGEQGNTNFVTNPDSGTVGTPSTYEAAVSVASISGVKSKYLVANDSQVIFFNESSTLTGEENDFFDEIYESLGKTKGDTIELEYVLVPGVGRRVNYSGVDVEGKIALVRRGDNTFEDKALQAKNAGAIGCIIYNNVDGDIMMSIGKADHIPTISISKDDGTILASQSKGKIVLSYEHEAGPFMSNFSSWGPMPDLQLKPDITAHGGNIRSSVPGGTYDDISGTSMACPNLCGIVVLIRQVLKERYPDYSPRQIAALTNQMMMSTATIALNEEGIPYSPRKQGAGLASLSKVVNTGAYLTVFEKDGNEIKDRTKIELYDDPDRTGVYDMTFNVVNTSDTVLKYNLSLVGMTESVSTSDPSHVAETGHILEGGFDAKAVGNGGTVVNNVVTVQPNSTLKISLKYTLTENDKDTIDSLFPYGMYVEGFVKLTAISDNDDQTVEVDLNVPFLAFYGDWTQAPMFDKTFYEVESEKYNGAIDEEDKIKADYFATTPYGSYYNNYIIPVGTYLYDIDESKYTKIVASEAHAALGDTLGTIDGIYAVYAGLLRNAKKLTVTVTDKVTGEVMYENILENQHKAYSQGGSAIPNYAELRMSSYTQGLLNNRVYEFKMAGLLDYGDGGVANNVRNTFTFDFTMDNEAPVIKAASYDKEYDRTLRKNRYYLNLTIYDNHYVQSVSPVSFQRTNNPETPLMYKYLTDLPIPVYSDRGTDNYLRFEITDFLENLYYDDAMSSGLGIIVDDYALNPNLYILQLPGNALEGGALRFTQTGEMDDPDLTMLYMTVDQVIDLTKYLATSDTAVDEDKDFLKYLSWTSSNTSVAVVEEGQVRAVRASTTTGVTITVTDPNPFITNNVSATIRIMILPKGTDLPSSGHLVVDDYNDSTLSSVRFTYFDTVFAHAGGMQVSYIGETGDKTFLTTVKGSLSFYPGEQIRLSFDVEPWYVKGLYTYTFESTNPEAATVDNTGLVTAVKEGRTTIRLRVTDKNGNVSAISANLSVVINSPFVIDEARTLVAYKGVDEIVEIPDDEGILYIAPYAFSLFTYNNDIVVTDEDIYANRIPNANTFIKKVIIPEGVVEIQQNAFMNCSALEEVVIPTTCKYIRKDAFKNCTSLTTINLFEDMGTGDKDDNVWIEAIGDRAFENCIRLNNIDLSQTYSIGKEAFKNCQALEYVDLTELRNTGANAFENCVKLTSVTFDVNGNSKLSEGMFKGAGLTSVSIYEKKIIPANCFADNKSLATVALNNAPEQIMDSAFSGCSKLTTLTLPNGEIQLNDVVFAGCSSLEALEFQSGTRLSFKSSGGVSTIGSAFSGSRIKQITVAADNPYYTAGDNGRLLLSKDGTAVILAATGASFGDYTLPANYTQISYGAFSGTDITKLTILNSNLIIGDYAFAECLQLKEVVLPATAGTLEIGSYAFASSKSVLDAVQNLDKVNTVGSYAFAVTALKEVTLGAGSTYGEGAFYMSSLITVTIGEGAQIGASAFQRCTNLTTVNMPAEVTLGEACFANATRLTTIDLSNLTEIAAETFNGCTSLSTAILTNATVIGNSAFGGCTSLTTLEMPKVEKIGDYAFSGNLNAINNAIVSGNKPANTNAPKFTSVVLPDTLKEIGAGAFAGCTALAQITIPAGISEIPYAAFALCSSLSNVQLSDDVTTIGLYAFYYAGIENINLGKVELIDEGAFAFATELKTIDLSSAKEVGYVAFAESGLAGTVSAPNLEAVDVLAFTGTAITAFNAPKLAYIGSEAFGNTRLTSFTVSTNLEYIGGYVFIGTATLTNFYYGAEGTLNGENDYVKVSDGVLYTKLESGNYQLNSVPGGKQIEVLEVIEGTVRIEIYAGNENKTVNKIILPDTLKVIGNYAFYGYTSLRTVEFRSVTAPVLEDYHQDVYLPSNAPGYRLLHSQLALFGWELYYYNFVDLLGTRATIAMILPSNSDISGYDSLVYEGYFGKVEYATRSTYVAMQQKMRDFIEYATKVEAISKITLNDEKLISNAVAALNAVTQDYKQFGYTEEEWNRLATAVNSARARILELKLETASKAARDIQARINALPDEYDGSAEMRAMFEQLTREYNLLSRSDKDALDITRYTSFRASLESYSGGSGGSEEHTHVDADNDGKCDVCGEDMETDGGDNGGQGSSSGSGCGGCGSVSFGDGMFGGGITLLCVIALFAVFAFVRKKRIQ